MPELPEVESVKLQLQSFLIGHTIEEVKINFPKTFQGDKKSISDTKIIDVRRFAKVLSIDLENGYSIVIHIKLTGQLIYRGPKLKVASPLSKKVVGGVPGPHTLVVFELNDNGFLYYNDIRRFGWIKIIRTEDVEKVGFVSKLGPEPHVAKGFEGQALTPEKFEHIVKSTKRAIKTLIMDQSKISGIGNIYANDALWLAKIHPGRPANSLSQSEQYKLYSAIETVLRKGLKTGGASELAFVTPDGSEGEYQKHFLAYGKVDVLCSRCKKGKFEKIRIAGRGTNFCSVCQKLLA